MENTNINRASLADIVLADVEREYLTILASAYLCRSWEHSPQQFRIIVADHELELGVVDGQEGKPARSDNWQYLDGYSVGYKDLIEAAKEQREEWDAQDKIEREFKDD
jgi:hypothetical protein